MSYDQKKDTILIICLFMVFGLFGYRLGRTILQVGGPL